MEYLLKSTAILTIFYLFYKIFLQNETFFKSIRTYFLIGIISALILPSIVITKYLEASPINIPVGMTFTENSTITALDTINWLQVFMIVYAIGVVFFTIRFLSQLSSLIWFLYTHSKLRRDKYILIETTKNIAPFSFFNYIVYNRDDFDNKELEQIFAHEKVHANQLHSFDIILIQCIAILNWFNPFIWLYHKEMQKNLEFTADEFAQDITREKKKYQYLLLKTISPNYKIALASNFYNSLIKKRIDMLHKNRSNKNNQIKFALILPVLLAFVFTFNTEVVAQNKTAKKKVTVEKNIQVMIISKDETESELEQIEKDFLNEGVTVNFKGIKRNSKGEITAIKIDVSTKTSNANYNTNSDYPIKPIRISYDSDGNSISIGNSSVHHGGEMYFVSNDDGNIEKHIVKIGGNGKQVWVSSDDDGKKVHKIEIIEMEGDDHGKNVWVTKTGDSTKLKIIEIHKDHDSSPGEISKTVWVTEDGDKTEEIIIKEIHGEHSKGENMIFIDSSSEDALLIIDGKEVNNTKLEDIDPSTIEKMEIFKGEKAIEKYGEKAKDGVIKITTKK